MTVVRIQKEYVPKFSEEYKNLMSSPTYLDIFCTEFTLERGSRTHQLDPETVELCFLFEIVDNPAHTLTKYRHLDFPLPGELPLAMSSTGSILESCDIIEILQREYSKHTDHDLHFSTSFPNGLDYYIQRVLGNVIRYLLYGNENICDSYTRPALGQIFGHNVVYGVIESAGFSRSKKQKHEESLIHSVENCVESLTELLAVLSHSSDLTEAMRLPMRLTSKLFAYMSVLLTIPLDDASLRPLDHFLLQNPQIAAIEKWCEQINDGCKLYPRNAINWRESVRTGAMPKAVERMKSSWWNWIGIDSWDEPVVSEERQDFVVDKRHNVFFVMTAVSAVFIYFASLGSYK